jgi:hypothetical protein
MRYARTQAGKLTFAVFGVVVALISAILIPASIKNGRMPTVELLALGLTLVFVFAVMLVFSRLTITIDDERIAWSFGAGWPKFDLPLSEVQSVKAVKNSVFYGYGIRVVPRGMLYNVSGRDAVEITRHDGKVIRLGTDQPDQLLAAIDGARRG